MIIITVQTRSRRPTLDKYTAGNYSGEACLSGAVRTVIAGGMAGYRDADRAASATPAAGSDFDYKKSRGTDGEGGGGLPSEPAPVSHVLQARLFV